LGNVFPRTFDVVRPAASDAIMDRLGFTPLLVSLIQTSTRPLPGVHMNAIGVSSTLSVPYSSLGRFPTVSRHVLFSDCSALTDVLASGEMNGPSTAKMPAALSNSRRRMCRAPARFKGNVAEALTK
jgi:hypothetical protein